MADEAAPKTYKLTYFCTRTRLMHVRMLLEYAGVDYDMVVMPFRDWGEAKETFKHGCLPVLEDAAGKTISQTGAICRHLARKYDLYGPDDDARAHVDELVELGQEMLNSMLKWCRHKDGKSEEAVSQAKTDFHRTLGQLEAAADADGGFFVGDSFTLGDAAAYGAIYCFAEPTVRDELSEERYPKLRKWMDRVRSLEQLADYFDSGRMHQCSMPPFVHSLCTPEEFAHQPFTFSS